MNVTGVSFAANDLGESPYWDIDAGIYAWRRRVHALDPATGETRCFDPAIEGAGARGLPEPRFGA